MQVSGDNCNQYAAIQHRVVQLLILNVFTVVHLWERINRGVLYNSGRRPSTVLGTHVKFDHVYVILFNAQRFRYGRMDILLSKGCLVIIEETAIDHFAALQHVQNIDATAKISIAYLYHRRPILCRAKNNAADSVACSQNRLVSYVHCLAHSITNTHILLAWNMKIGHVAHLVVDDATCYLVCTIYCTSIVSWHAC